MVCRVTGNRHLKSRIIAACWLVLVIAAPGTGFVFAQDNLYSVVVPLDASEANPQQKAQQDALQLVLVRVTGSADPQQILALQESFPPAENLVLRLQSAPDNSLRVTFDGGLIERYLRSNRQTIWGADRPVTLVWLAVDWGQGEREIVAADTERDVAASARSIDRNRQLRERVEQVAEFRGIPVIFPLQDTEDRQALGFGDIWGGFDELILEASRRYGASSVLVGRIDVNDPLRNRWTYYFGDDRLTWSGEPEQVTNLVADELAMQFGVRGDAALETYALTIDGVDSVLAYGNIQRMMDTLGVVEQFAVQSVDGQTIQYRVSVYGGIDRLSKALELSGMLEPDVMVDNDTGQGPLSDPRLLSFHYRP